MKLIEQDTLEGNYGLNFTEVVVEVGDSKIYACEGYGGEGDLQGGQYRWQHGLAVKLRPDDSLRSLKETSFNEHSTIFEAMLRGFDKDRPITKVPSKLSRLV